MRYITTIQILIDVEDDHHPVDAISEIFSENLVRHEIITSWSYLKVGEQYLYPTEAWYIESLGD